MQTRLGALSRVYMCVSGWAVRVQDSSIQIVQDVHIS